MTKLYLLQEFKVGLIFAELINIPHHINRIKKTYNQINAEKEFERIQILLIIKTLEEIWNRIKCPQSDKEHLQETIAYTFS